MRNRFTNVGWLVTVIVVFIPIVIWLATQPTQWNTVRNSIESLGKLAGLAGLSLMAWNVILSARLKIFDRLFMGLDNMYRAHHLIGSTAFIFLLIHPMLLTLRYLIGSFISAYEFIKPSFESPFRLLGILTLGAMIVLMFITLYLKIKHERFVLVQRLLGMLLFLGGLHALFVGGSDINSLLLLQIYIISLLMVAAIVYLYRSLFHGSFSKFYDYRVESVQQKGDVLEIWLQPKDKPVVFLPGQFAFIKLQTNGILAQSHPFSISSNPGQKRLRFSVKQLGNYTQALKDIKKGQPVKIDAAYGSFSNKIIHNPRQVWIAGGIGITPFLSMVSSLDNSQRVDLYYSVKNRDEAVYLQELQKAALIHKNLQVSPIYTGIFGYITADYIFTKSKNLDNAAFLICGPLTMMKILRAQLKHLSVVNRNIHTEEFNLK